MSSSAGANPPSARVDPRTDVADREPGVTCSVLRRGVYLANELFPQLGIAGEMKAKTRVVGVTGVVVAKGDADIAIQQISELLPVAGIDYVGPLPREIQKVRCSLP